LERDFVLQRTFGKLSDCDDYGIFYTSISHENEPKNTVTSPIRGSLVSGIMLRKVEGIKKHLNFCYLYAIDDTRLYSPIMRFANWELQQRLKLHNYLPFRDYVTEDSLTKGVKIFKLLDSRYYISEQNYERYNQEYEMLKDTQVWFDNRDGLTGYKDTYVDYGRSHYFFLDGSDENAKKVERFCYITKADTDLEARTQFFINECHFSSALAERANREVISYKNTVVCRVKFELLRNWLISKGFGERATIYAMKGLLATTQRPLHSIKRAAMDTYTSLRPGKHIYFPTFQINWSVEDTAQYDSKKIYLRVTFINYIPTSEVWQGMYRLPIDNERKVKATFVLDITSNEDLGNLKVQEEGPYGSILSNEQRLCCIGVFNATTNTRLNYKDTTPTW